ncbi:uncharacterized protein LOC122242780 [Penaeus japonicus]|uniref:uncharacterized protein LOC122242780 n=1 Tax=Penaeus japonicus TaxID=27405 RepID=UPI001C70E681|nr:uncharacterized protein LOC122242780 [Penaeus japonicus]
MCSPWDNVTVAHLAAALAVDKGNESVLVSWSFGESPDTFGHHRVAEVKYTLDGNECDVTYGVKCVGRGPGADEFHALLFEKEYGFYEELAPAINTVLQETGQRSLRIPRCFTHARTDSYEVMVLEDLSTRGFLAANRHLGLDLSHTLLAIQELARLHAASSLLQHRNADKPLAHTYPFVGKEWTKAFKRGDETYETFLTKYVDLGVAMLEKLGCRERDVAWLKGIRPKVWPLFLEQLETTPQFAVVCHGDSWSSNILFRYDSLDTPVEAIFVDLQQVRLASPATDIHALLAANVPARTRLIEHSNLLYAYHMTFKDVMEAGGAKMPFTLSNLEDEFKSKALYAILSALVFTPSAMQAGGGNLNPLSKDQSLLKMEKAEVLEMLDKDPDLRTRLLGVFEEWANEGFMS